MVTEIRSSFVRVAQSARQLTLVQDLLVRFLAKTKEEIVKEERRGKSKKKHYEFVTSLT